MSDAAAIFGSTLSCAMHSLANPIYFEQVFREHWEMMYQAAYRKIRNQAVVEDLIQEIFEDIWNRRHTLSIQNGIKAYLLTAVKYQVMRHIDRQGKNQLVGTDELATGYEDDIFGFEELYSQIEVAIRALPPRAGLIFKMSRLEGDTVDEIAKKLKLHPQTVHNQLSRSLKFMRGELKHLAPILAILLTA